MSASQRPRVRSIEPADGVMLAVVFIWAINNVLTKTALDRGLEPLIYVTLRFAIVVAILLTYLTLRGMPVRIRRSDLPRFIVSGLCGFAFYNMLFVVGLSRTSAFSSAILISLAPIFILLISAMFGLERVRGLQWLGASLSLFGVAIFIGGKLLAGEPAIGDLLNVIAALSFAIYGLTTRDLVIRYGPLLTIAWSVAIALIAVLPFTARALWNEDWSALSALEWTAILYAAVISMMVAYSLWGWAIARTGAGRSVPYLFLIPVFTGILAVAFRGDRLATTQLIGGAIVLAGVAVARRFALPPKRVTTIHPTGGTRVTPDTELEPRTVTGP